MHWWQILVELGVLLLVVTLLTRRRNAQRARTEALRQASTASGLGFQAEGDVEQMKALGNLPLYSRGHGTQVTNVMSGRAATDAVIVFDYKYTTGGGKESRTWRQTVALYPAGALGLPDFVLAPENVFHKLGQLLGYQDIDFDSTPLFSSRYLLRGPDEAAIRSAFTVDTRSFFEQELGWTVEVQGGNVGIYRAGKLVDPGQPGVFLQETATVLRALTHR